MSMKVYGKYLLRYQAPFFIAIFCVMGEAVCDLLGPTFMARMIDEGIAANAMHRVFFWGGMMLLFTCIGAVFAIGRNVLSSHISQRIGADLRHDLFAKIMNFSQAGTDQLDSGSLITRMTNDTTQITQFVNGMMRIFLKAPITCIGSIVLASILNFKLSIIIYTVVVLVGVLIFFSMKLSYPRFALLQKAMDKINSVMQEYLIGIRLVKAFGTYDEENEKFSDANTALLHRGIATQMVITLIAPLLTLTAGLGTAAVLFCGSKLFLRGEILPGNISAFTIYMTQILSSLLMITNIFNTFVRTKASTARIADVLHAGDDFPHTGKTETLCGNIAFENVTFSYPNSSAPALRNVSFTAKPGESLAIIGPTGSGKSTICWLLLRFYDATSGAILLDGRKLCDMDVDIVREIVGLVPQNPMLFSGTVAENIRWGNADATDAMVKTAAKQAEADDFICNMDHGYASMLGSAGVNISGGQKQRISIARGILKNAPILLLDDATSALDAITEAHVRKTLQTIAKTRTVITVTQRCTTAMFFDKILVLEDGGCTGYDTHAALLKNCSVYRDIYQSQVDSSMGGDCDV